MIFNCGLQDQQNLKVEAGNEFNSNLESNYPTVQKDFIQKQGKNALRPSSSNTSEKQRIKNDISQHRQKEIIITDILDLSISSKDKSFSANASSEQNQQNQKERPSKLKITEIYDDDHVNPQNLKQISKVNSRQKIKGMDHKEEPQSKNQKMSNNISLCNTKEFISIPRKENQKPGSLIVVGQLTPENIIEIVDCFLYRAVKIYRVKLINNEQICVTANNLMQMCPKLIQNASLPNKK